MVRCEVHPCAGSVLVYIWLPLYEVITLSHLICAVSVYNYRGLGCQLGQSFAQARQAHRNTDLIHSHKLFREGVMVDQF